MVGWRTSSIRREKDLVKVAVLAQLILGNLHVALNEWHLNRSYCASICSPPIVHWMVLSTLWMLSTVRLYHQRDPIFLPRLPGLKKLHNKLQTQKIPRNTTKWWRVSMNFALHTYVRCAEVSRFLDELWTLILETEEMTHGLQKVGWKKVDVSFHSSFWPYLAHNNIHVWGRSSFVNAFFWSDIFSPVSSKFLFLSKRTTSKFMLWCRSRTSGFTTLVLVLSHTSLTASSSRSHGHVFLRIYSVSILAPYLLAFSVTSKPTASFRLAFSVTSKPTASFRFTEQRDIWYWEDRMSHVLVASLNLTMGSRLSGVMISDAVCSYVLHTPVVLQQILLKQWCIQSWIRDNPKFHMMSRTVF